MIKTLLENISIRISSGLTPLRSNLTFWDSADIPWVKTEQLGEKNIYDSNEKISYKALEETGLKLNPKNTLTIAMYGEGKTRGSVSILRNEVTTNQACCNIVIDNQKANFEYVYYFLKIQYDNLRNLSSGVRKNLNSGDIKNFEIRIPESLEHQSQIAKILSDLDAKIELNNKMNSELEAMAKLIYDYWFVQFEFPLYFAQGEPNEDGKPYKSSGGKMVWDEELKREIPEGWEVKTLGDCINIYDSLRVPLARAEREKIEGTIPYYGATSVMGYVNDYLFDDEYILLAEDGSVMDEKGMPIVQFIWGKTWVNNHAHVIQAVDKIHNEFIYQLVKMIPVVLIKTGSIQMKINQENLKNYKVLIPSIELVEKYSKNASDIRKQLINNIEQNQKLAELRDWLLPMLMNGQVRIDKLIDQIID